MAELCGRVAPSKLALILPIGETFSRKANGTRGAIMPRQQVVFYHRFLNTVIILCSRPNRAVNDILKNCGDFLKSMAILNFSVCKGHA